MQSQKFGRAGSRAGLDHAAKAAVMPLMRRDNSAE
jgi:hypothetical protein